MHPAADLVLRFLTFAIVHSLLATPSIVARCHYYIPGTQRWMRLFYNILSIIMFGWVLLAWPGAPVIYMIPGAWSLLFYFMQLAALALLIKCAAQLGIIEFLGFTQHDADPAQFVTAGCYGKVRHPQYSLGMLFMILNPVMTAKWLMLTVMSGLYFWWGGYIEEKRLCRDVGNDFRKYQKLVPMFIPKFSRRKQPPNRF